jgi:hypothetical protein
VPSLVEVSVVVGAFAALALAYTLAERCLPMGEHSGHATGAFLGSADRAGTVDARPAMPAPSAPTPTPATPTVHPAPVAPTAHPVPAEAPIITQAPVVSPTPVFAPASLHDGTGAVL